MQQLEGKVAVITGSTRGLGLAITQSYAAEGAAVVVSSRSTDAVRNTVDLLKISGFQAAGLAVDVGNLEQVQALAEFAMKTFGRIDIWVNNAGITGPYGPTIDLSPEIFSGVVQTNILGTYYGSVTALHVFKKQGGGKLINVLGMGYNKPAPMQNVYGSSKVWIRHFTKALAAENKNNPAIGIYALNPGMVLTELLTHFDVVSGSEERLKVFPTIIRMWAKPADIPARKAVWLASPATDGKTGVEGNVFSTWVMLQGAVREGLHKMTGRKAPAGDIQMKVIAPWVPKNK
jgi:NAD(P)-dependent dehydrogenase (short-subunit alcohol dehydrogenase family)